MKMRITHICNVCKNLVFQKEFYSSIYPEKLKKRDLENSKINHQLSHNNFELVVEKICINTKRELGQKIIHFDDNCEFVLNTIDKIEKMTLLNTNTEEMYYYNNNFSYNYFYFPDYANVNLVPTNEIYELYDDVPFIDYDGKILLGSIYGMFSITKKDKKVSYLDVGKLKLEISDICRLSSFLEQFDKYNSEAGENEPIQKYLDDYKKFKNYWIKKYFGYITE